MRFSSLRFAPLALLAAGGLACRQPAPAAPPAAPRDGVFIHVSSGPADAHRVLMALRMAELMAGDHDVLVYFDVEGIEVVLADAPEIEYAAFPAAHGQIQKLLDLGVALFACPGCLEAAGKSAADLRPGVQVTSKDAFFAFTEGRILTLDY
jgi:predicted peroxiredoxin